MKTHIQEIGFLPLGKGTSDQVSLAPRAENSAAIACLHLGNWTSISYEEGLDGGRILSVGNAQQTKVRLTFSWDGW